MVHFSTLFFTSVALRVYVSAGPILHKRIAQTIADSTADWVKACQAAGGTDKCGTVSQNAFMTLLAAGKACDQQDAADAMIDLAKTLNNDADMVRLTQLFVQQPRNAPDSLQVPYCQTAPKNAELNGLFHCQFQGTVKNSFSGDQTGNTPIGVSAVNPAGSCPAKPDGPVPDGVQLNTLVKDPGVGSGASSNSTDASATSSAEGAGETSDSSLSGVSSNSTDASATSSAEGAGETSDSSLSGVSSNSTDASATSSAESADKTSTDSSSSASTDGSTTLSAETAGETTSPGSSSNSTDASTTSSAETAGETASSSDGASTNTLVSLGSAATATDASSSEISVSSSTDTAASSASTSGSSASGFQKQNGEDALALQQKFTSLTASSPCNNGEDACVQGGFAQCVGGKFAITQCAGGTQCFALPLVNKPGTSLACTTQEDFDARIAASGASNSSSGASATSSAAGVDETSTDSSSSSSGISSAETTGETSIASSSDSSSAGSAAFVASAASPSATSSSSTGFQKQNGEDALALQKKFASLAASSPCNEGENACVQGGFAQCVGGKFAITQCSGGTQCFALPLVNKPGTSIACTTKSDFDARIAASGASA